MAREVLLRCAACKADLPEDSFHRSTSRASGRAAYCRSCKKQKSRDYYVANREAVLESQRVYYEAHRDGRLEANRRYRESRSEILAKTGRERHLRAKYGITHEQYERMLEEQGHVCAICGKPETFAFKATGTPYALAVDHDHATGVVRGLLCSYCNILVGQIERNPAAVAAALEYLRSPGE